MLNSIEKILFSETEIKSRVKELAADISRDLKDTELVVLTVLKGGAILSADLVRELDFPVTLDYIAVSSYYSGTQSTGNVQIKKDTDINVNGKTLLIIEDIVDSGNTIVELVKIMQEHGASESRICTMLLKPDAYKKDIKLDYVAMEIPNDFIIGFGLDYDEYGRNLKDIYVLDTDEE